LAHEDAIHAALLAAAIQEADMTKDTGRAHRPETGNSNGMVGATIIESFRGCTPFESGWRQISSTLREVGALAAHPEFDGAFSVETRDPRSLG
jgi:hypothetical protein